MTIFLDRKVILYIAGRLSGLNEYTKACRTNKYAGAKLKEQNEKKVAAAIYGTCPTVTFRTPVQIIYRWYEKNKRRDKDNIAFAKKFINDALVECGTLQGDGWQYVVGFVDEFYIDKENPHVEVEIREVEV